MQHSEEAIWLDICERNPKQDGETFSEWLERLGDIMDACRPGQVELTAQREREP